MHAYYYRQLHSLKELLKHQTDLNQMTNAYQKLPHKDFMIVLSCAVQFQSRFLKDPQMVADIQNKINSVFAEPWKLSRN